MSAEVPNKSVKQLAQFLGLSDDIVYRNVASGAWPCHRSRPPDRGRILFSADDVEEIQAIMRVRPHQPINPVTEDAAGILAAYQKQLARAA